MKFSSLTFSNFRRDVPITCQNYGILVGI